MREMVQNPIPRQSDEDIRRLLSIFYELILAIIEQFDTRLLLSICHEVLVTVDERFGNAAPVTGTLHYRLRCNIQPWKNYDVLPYRPSMGTPITLLYISDAQKESQIPNR
jgi:hypothetical protein